MHLPYRALVTSMFVAPAVLAATADKPAVATVRCRVLAIGKAPAGEIYVKTGGKYAPLAISTDFIGKSFRTETKNGITFYRKRPEAELKKPGAEKKEPYVAFASCKPDGAAARQLVFFSPAPGEGWSVVAKSDLEGRFPLGTRLVFNLSTHAVNFDFGGTRLLVNPRQSGLLLPPAKSDQSVAPIMISRQDSGGKWIPFCSSTWLHDPAGRKIVLLSPYGPDKVSLTSIQDRPEEKDAEEKAGQPKAK